MIPKCDCSLPRFLRTFFLTSLFCLAQESAPHAESDSLLDRIWLSGQVNVVSQIQPPFHSPYTGRNSLQPGFEAGVSWVATIYTGFAINKSTEVFFDLESARGPGVSGALGLGAISDLDAVTNPSATAAPYVARALVRRIIGLGSEKTDATRSPLGLNTSVPVKRLEIIAGKMSLTDYFDLNSVGSDSHLQFLSDAIDHNAAYKIAANARGYTHAVLMELHQPLWTARFTLAFEPKDTSGNQTDWNLSRSRSENFEIETHPTLIQKRATVLRGLVFVNHATMASYSQAIDGYLEGADHRPDLTFYEKPGQENYGFGFNGEQEITERFRVCGRYGWYLGTKEEAQFAEADWTVTFGGDLDGKTWHREGDHAGLALAINSLTAEHARYLQLGGTTYLLGDGALNYGHETTLEGYYNVPLHFHGVYGAFDLQRIWNPGYNRDRGPVVLFGLRLHLESEVHLR
jgi:high affinity Mn2+ porin